jgi:hypothetical protein
MAVSRLSGVRLTRKAEEFLTQMRTELRKSGASDTDIEKATAGLVKAIFANSRIDLVKRVLRVIISVIMCAIIALPFLLLPYTKFIGTNLLSNKSGTGMGYLIYIWLIVAAVVGSWKQLLLSFLDIGQRHGRAFKELFVILWKLLVILGIILCILIGGFEIWREWFSNIEEISIWRVAVVILSGVWIISFWNITIKLYQGAEPRILAFLRPESALIISLCKAFLAVRNEASWHDQTYRDRIAGDLAVAIDAVEKFMPRVVAAEAGFSSLAAVRQRFKETAIPLREQIVWLATPGPLTRTDLEAELRNALIAASLGELARLEEFLKRFPDRTQPILLALRPWWVVIIDRCRAIAWAVTPLALVWLGSAWQLPLLSEPDQQASAQKAAYIWLALAILRGLSPGNFKETIEAATTLSGRSKPKGTD